MEKHILDHKHRPLLIAGGISAAVVTLAGTCLCCGAISWLRASGTSEEQVAFSHAPGGRDEGDNITFDNEVWKTRGERHAVPGGMAGLIFYPIFDGGEHKGDRLLVLQRESGTIRKQIFVQRQFDGGWKEHGLYQDWTDSGESMIRRNVEGQPEGETTHYFPNGKVLIHEHYKVGKLHGRSERWWPNGKKQYEIEYNLGQEIWAKVWNEDGTPTR